MEAFKSAPCTIIKKSKAITSYLVRERVVGAEHLATALFPTYIIIEPDVKYYAFV